MADQELGLRMKTTSDVPDAMDKAKKATVSFGKQVEDVQKKFSTAFKDIALSFIAPLVILNKAIDMISNSIEKSKQDIKDLRDFAAAGESPYLTAQAKYLANLRVATDKERAERGMAPKATQEEYAYFLMNDPRSRGVLESAGLSANLKALIAGIFSSGDEGAARSLAGNKDVQAAIDAIIVNAAKDFEKQKSAENAAKSKSGTYTPQGVNAVVGMGNNAALDAMTAQLEEQRKQTMLLEQIANGQSYTPPDFTKPTVAAPSRSYLLTK